MPANDGDFAATVLGQTLVFRAGAERFGMPLKCILEVFEQPTQAAPVPGAPAWLAGIINHHGRVYPVVRLDKLLGVDPHGEARQMMLVDLAEERIALMVDQIESLEHLRSEGPAVQGRKRAWLKGAMMTLIDPAALERTIAERLAKRSP